MIQLSSNFSLKEFTRSDTASRTGIKEQFEPSETSIAAIKALVVYVLQPLRTLAGGLRVTSGYRCPRLNAAVKGEKTSQHQAEADEKAVPGAAADIDALAISNADVFDLAIQHHLPFDQLIWEYGTDTEPDWIHVSYGPRNRRQILRVLIDEKTGKKRTIDLTKKYPAIKS